MIAVLMYAFHPKQDKMMELARLVATAVMGQLNREKNVMDEVNVTLHVKQPLPTVEMEQLMQEKNVMIAIKQAMMAVLQVARMNLVTVGMERLILMKNVMAEAIVILIARKSVQVVAIQGSDQISLD